MRERAYMSLIRLMPREAFSNVIGSLTRASGPSSVHRAAMRAFAKFYGVNLEEMEGDFADYPTFAQFFTRRLKAGLRPIDQTPDAVVSPVDGTVSESGYVAQGCCVQAKGIDYPVEKLLANDQRAAKFEGGAFATLYLSPKDYH